MPRKIIKDNSLTVKVRDIDTNMSGFLYVEKKIAKEMKKENLSFALWDNHNAWLNAGGCVYVLSYSGEPIIRVVSRYCDYMRNQDTQSHNDRDKHISLDEVMHKSQAMIGRFFVVLERPEIPEDKLGYKPVVYFYNWQKYNVFKGANLGVFNLEHDALEECRKFFYEVLSPKFKGDDKYKKWRNKFYD